MTHPPLLFIHGFRGSPTGMQPIIDQFPNYSTYAPFIPPSGNKNTLETYDLEHYIDYISNYIIDNHIRQPILIGHSMGSVLAAAVAAYNPKLVHDKLILLSPISVKVSKSIAHLQPLITALPNQLIKQITTDYIFIPKRQQNQLLQQTPPHSITKAGAIRAARLNAAKIAKFSANYSISDFNLSGKQVHIIAGKRDRIIPHQATDILGKILHTNPIYIPGAGHLINYEAPFIVANLIRECLEK